MTATRRMGLFLAAVLVVALLALPGLAPAQASGPATDSTAAQVSAATAGPAPHDATRFTVHRHEQGPALVAQSLGSARWDVSAVGAQWTHRAPWKEPATGAGIRVAILDTGIDASHPDLAGKIVAWRDLVDARAVPYDDDGHGTQVAGTIAAGGHLQIDPTAGYFPRGARGIAPGVSIIAAKAMDASGEGDPNLIAEAILWSLDPDGDGDPSDGANIINLSLGVVLPPPPEPAPGDPATGALSPRQNGEMGVVAEAVRTAVRAGAVVVVSAGNHDPGDSGYVTFPGTMPEVITVGATDAHGRLAPFSNEGRAGSGKPDLVAPGVLYTTGLGGAYAGAGGTSLATPLVAGAIALLMEADPRLEALSLRGDRSENTETIRAILTTTARPLPGALPEQQGAGLLRVDAALATVGPGEAGLRSELPYVVVLGGLVPLAVIRRRRSRRMRARESAARERTETQEAEQAKDDRWDPATAPRPMPVWDPAEHPRVVAAPRRLVPLWVPPSRPITAGVWHGPHAAVARNAAGSGRGAVHRGPHGPPTSRTGRTAAAANTTLPPPSERPPWDE